jgi:DNA-directed RNA polymerase specialized sigma24 family protein
VSSPLTPADAALLLAHGEGAAARRLRRAVDAQLARRGVLGPDRDDVRSEVALALLTAPGRDGLDVDAACALAARIARNKAVDHHRRRRREAPSELAGEVADTPRGGLLADDLDLVESAVHGRLVRASLRELVGALPDGEQRALRADAAGRGARGSGLARSTHYRALERARDRIAAAVRARIAGGLALPLALLRGGDALRELLVPAAVVLTAAAASVALVAPATLDASRPAPLVRAPRPLAATTRVAALAPVVHRLPVAAPARTAPPRGGHAVATRTAAPRPVLHAAHRLPPARATPIASRPDAGLGPCRAAGLCV